MDSLLRTFNEAGVSEFRSHLQKVRLGAAGEVPVHLLFGDEYSSVIGQNKRVEQIIFDSTLDAARYLLEAVKELPQPFYNVGLWTWLSAFYFDSVCPIEKNGARKPGADHRHILPPSRDWRHFYRHLLAGPVRTFDFHGEQAKLLLSGAVHKMSDIVEQLNSRQEIASNRGLVEAATYLYWDRQSERPKRGAAPNKRNPGTLRRLIDVIQQLELTYDLNSMNGQEILSLLPEEFTHWIKP